VGIIAGETALVAGLIALAVAVAWPFAIVAAVAAGLAVYFDTAYIYEGGHCTLSDIVAGTIKNAWIEKREARRAIMREQTANEGACAEVKEAFAKTTQDALPRPAARSLAR
jgi:hypothetical protein